MGAHISLSSSLDSFESPGRPVKQWRVASQATTRVLKLVIVESVWFLREPLDGSNMKPFMDERIFKTNKVRWGCQCMVSGISYLYLCYPYYFQESPHIDYLVTSQTCGEN